MSTAVFQHFLRIYIPALIVIWMSWVDKYFICSYQVGYNNYHTRIYIARLGKMNRQNYSNYKMEMVLIFQIENGKYLFEMPYII